MERGAGRLIAPEQQTFAQEVAGGPDLMALAFEAGDAPVVQPGKVQRDRTFLGVAGDDLALDDPGRLMRDHQPFPHDFRSGRSIEVVLPCPDQLHLHGQASLADHPLIKRVIKATVDHDAADVVITQERFKPAVQVGRDWLGGHGHLTLKTAPASPARKAAC